MNFDHVDKNENVLKNIDAQFSTTMYSQDITYTFPSVYLHSAALFEYLCMICSPSVQSLFETGCFRYSLFKAAVLISPFYPDCLATGGCNLVDSEHFERLHNSEQSNLIPIQNRLTPWLFTSTFLHIFFAYI